MLQQWKLRSRLGLSLLEFALGAALLAAMALYLANPLGTDQQAQAVVEEDPELAVDMRRVAETIERDIRHAGFLVPASGAACAVDNASSPDLLYLSNADVLDPGDEGTRADHGASLPVDNVAVGTNPDWPVALVLDAEPDYDTDGDGVADSDFLVGGGVIVTDRRSPERGSACGTVLGVRPSDGTLSVEIRSSPLGPGRDADLVALPAHQYRIEAGDVLSRNGVELARGAADLQVAFFVDANRDNIEQAEEMLGDRAAPGYVSGNVDLRAAREIRVSTVLLARVGSAGEHGVRRLTHTTRELLRNVVTR